MVEQVENRAGQRLELGDPSHLPGSPIMRRALATSIAGLLSEEVAVQARIGESRRYATRCR